MENITISISMPKSIVNKIDSNRGDVNRSRFILRILESKFSQNLEVKNYE
jgi:metal-responsive CopG/Arc/MetJ family transcriptional regulator